ncbi:MAG: hypothetical protein KY447_02630 [Actinobacteria bacterium]|nr:hypothetical protein [Actinomycetota bacterium]
MLMSCVGENRPDWFRSMENLVLSVRRFGGSLAQVPFVVHVVGGADEGFVDAMRRLDAEVRVVEPVDRRRPSSNKLRMLELARERDDFDVLLALDCDLVVIGDLAREVKRGALRAVPAGRDVTEADTWQRLYRALGVPEPAKDCVTTVSGQRTYPYFNSGVMFVPHDVCALLLEHWRRHLDWLLGPGLAELGLPELRKDQIPLAAALATAGLHIDPLPINCNLTATASRVAAPYRHQWGPPFVLHYHKLIDDRGFLLPSPNTRINSLLDRFNRMRGDAMGLDYDGIGAVPLRTRVSAVVRDRPGDQALRRVLRVLRGRAV